MSTNKYSTKETRPLISKEINYKVNKLIDLPIGISFDKALKIILINYEKYYKFYKQNHGDSQK